MAGKNVAVKQYVVLKADVSEAGEGWHRVLFVCWPDSGVARHLTVRNAVVYERLEKRTQP